MSVPSKLSRCATPPSTVCSAHVHPRQPKSCSRLPASSVRCGADSDRRLGADAWWDAREAMHQTTATSREGWPAMAARLILRSAGRMLCTCCVAFCDTCVIDDSAFGHVEAPSQRNNAADGIDDRTHRARATPRRPRCSSQSRPRSRSSLGGSASRRSWGTCTISALASEPVVHHCDWELDSQGFTRSPVKLRS